MLGWWHCGRALWHDSFTLHPPASSSGDKEQKRSMRVSYLSRLIIRPLSYPPLTPPQQPLIIFLPSILSPQVWLHSSIFSFPFLNLRPLDAYLASMPCPDDIFLFFILSYFCWLCQFGFSQGMGFFFLLTELLNYCHSLVWFLYVWIGVGGCCGLGTRGSLVCVYYCKRIRVAGWGSFQHMELGLRIKWVILKIYEVSFVLVREYWILVLFLGIST